MFTIQFDFDHETKNVSNINVSEQTIKSLKRANKEIEEEKIQEKEIFDTNNATAEIDGSKILLSTSAIKLLKAKIGDKISVQYVQLDNKDLVPVIGKSEWFTSSLDGNVLKGSNCFLFKGSQNEVLSKYGQLFNLKEYTKGIFFLKEITFETFEESIDNLDDFDDMTEDEIDIDELI